MASNGSKTSPLDFDVVIAPLTRAGFVREYWDRQFVHIPGIAGRFAHLVTWEALNGMLEQHRLVPPRLKLYRGGQAIEPQRFLTPSQFGVPRIDGGGLAACIAEGASLILDDVQEMAPLVGALLGEFQQALHTDAFANLYASWHTANAFDLHWDPQSSIILQLSGRKHWTVYAPTRLHPLKNDLEPPPRPQGATVWDGMLEDGEMLYIPRGWWHVANPVGEPSLHLTVSLTPPTGMDFLGWAMARLRAETAMRANLPALATAGEQAAHLKALRRLVNDALGDDAMAQFLREWDANIRPTPHIDVNQAAYGQFAALTPASRIRLAALGRLVLAARDGNFEFQAAGRLWTVPPELKAALETLSNAKTVTVAALRAKAPGAEDKLLKSLGVLARAGVVQVEADDQSDPEKER